jgi:DNA-binding transcriptional ArsR family regulator/uncharacterized protein YndB with AHSA1/START domain
MADNEPGERIWQALASPIRREILDLLRDGPRTTGELAGAFPRLSRFAVMQHLGVLEECRLVLVRREGRQRFNALNAAPLRALYERWVSRYADAQSAAALALKRHVEKGAEMASEEAPSAGRVVKVETEVRLNAPVEKVFAALTSELDAWWPFRFRAVSTVRVEPFGGGRICEDWCAGRGVLYGTVTFFDPPNCLASRGPGGLDGNYTSVSWEFLERDGDGTKNRKSMRLWGEVTDELEAMFRQGQKVLGDERLRAYVEEGKGREIGSSSATIR